MQSKRPPIAVIVIVVLVLLVAGYFGIRALMNKGNTALTASGSIETVEVTISPEIGGKVSEVLVDEGSAVKSGDTLFRMDDTLLQAQRAVAAANLASAQAAGKTAGAALANAQAQYDLAFDASRAEAASTRTVNWTATLPSGYTLPGWFFTQDEAITAAQAEVDSAQAALADSQTKLDNLQNDPAAADFLAIEKRLNEARAAFQVADDVLTRAKAAHDNADLQLAAQKRYDSAKTDLDNAQSDYDDVSDHDVAKNIQTARAELAAAQERYQTAQDRLLALQYGDKSPKLAAAQAALDQAKATGDQATLAVSQAQANLDLIDAQIAKLTVKAPSDGVILTRSIEPGEVIPAGATAFTLGRLDKLTITVFIPEDRYGEVKLGQSVNVTVDPFPGETFTATVVHIADQAEYTPRNVQTVSGRKSTVFAIKLQVQDPNGKLKPGMPADVTFK
ncbi:MAG TPA: HlyD family efflux transporter periplasmic adaptor subunit [Anaerolineales bacterium]|nr:HlyD family efflux transporter periplasmic adaptor subunit [Anaerolineales bacterium]